MARGDKGYSKAKARTEKDTAKKDALLEKGRNHGRPGAPQFTRKEIKILKGMEKEEHG